MKRDLSVITDEVKELIRKWIDKKDDRACPFDFDLQLCSICKNIFPKLPKYTPYLYFHRHHDWSFVCPCDAFSVKYVIKVAEEIIKV